MKTSLHCYPCYLRQAMQLARLAGCSEEVQRKVVVNVAALFSELSLTDDPPTNSIKVYAKIAETTGLADPYAQQKRESNQRALAILDRLRDEVKDADEPTHLAIRFSIAGNIIDYGAHEHFDIDEALHKSRTLPLAIDHSRQLLDRLSQLAPNDIVLLLADNCGEIVYDTLLVELLANRGLQVVVAVKQKPIINDATMEDAVFVGMDKFARVIDNGTGCPGTPLQLCSSELLQYLDSAKIVISKGQGNFETLSEADREIFFLLTVKCPVVGQHLVELNGPATGSLSGNGEMVVFHKTSRN